MRKAGTMEDLVQGQHGSLKNGLEIPFVAPNWLSQHSYKGWEAQINSQLLLHPYYFEFQPPFFFWKQTKCWISPIFCWCFTMIQPPQGLVLLLMGSLVGLSEPPWPSPPLPPSRAGRLKVGNSSMFFKRGNTHLHYGYDRELLI